MSNSQGELHVGRAIGALSADVETLPVRPWLLAQALGEAAAENRQVRHIGRLGDTALRHHGHQARIDASPTLHQTLPELALIIAC